MKDAFRIDRKDYHVRLESVIDLMERAFEDAGGHGDHVGHLSPDRFFARRVDYFAKNPSFLFIEDINPISSV